ncbi:MAG: DUF2703 domain-containing protein [Nitrospiraceae bacterium]|nr:DUF2703 domain-containing protein [Nitrospiraceae bacterium]
MKTLTITWQRLLINNNQTCDRCGSTEEEIEKAYLLLKKSLSHLDIDVVLEKSVMDISAFKKTPLESNSILIAERPLEYWIKADVGQRPCCGPCGDNECRTIKFNNQTYETIPSELIIKAGLLAAAEMIHNK